METIIIATVIAVLAAVAIWYYNRDANTLDINRDGRVDTQDVIRAAEIAAKKAAEDARDARDTALVVAAESAMKAAGVIERQTKAVKKVARQAATKPTADKKPAARKPHAKK